jgi:hypothetical protein
MSDEEWAKIPRAIVENQAAGRPRDDPYLGRAKVELLKRDHAYAEAQELDRRQYEDDRAATRRDFEDRLMRRQMKHASALASEQLDTARSARNAARCAAGAAIMAAIAALAQVIISAVK